MYGTDDTASLASIYLRHRGVFCSIQHSHISIVFVTAQHLPTLLTLAPKVPMLKMVVSIDDLSEESRKVVTTWGKTIGVDIKELRECE